MNTSWCLRLSLLSRNSLLLILLFNLVYSYMLNQFSLLVEIAFVIYLSQYIVVLH